VRGRECGVLLVLFLSRKSFFLGGFMGVIGGMGIMGDVGIVGIVGDVGDVAL
jgi:hypothetical protein